MTEILIHEPTGAEVQRWGGSPNKVNIPGSRADVVFVGDAPRPLDIGPDHFLAVAQVNKPPLASPNQKYGAEQMNVTPARGVTLTTPIEGMSAEEIATRDKSEGEGELRSSVKQNTELVIGLIDLLVTKGVIEVRELDGVAKQNHADLKASNDKARA